MLPIILVRHPVKFYLMQVLGFIIVGGIGFGISWGCAQGINSSDVKQSDYLFLVIGMLFVFVAFYILWKYFKNAPLIKADESTITFASNEIYQISDIADVQLTGKVSFPMLLDFPVEGTTLHFKNGTKKFFFDDLYSNAWELKTFLEQTVVNKKPYEVRVSDMTAEEPDLAYMEVFKGNPVFSFRGMMLWVTIGFMLYLMLSGPRSADPKVIWAFIGLSMFWFVGISNHMNYFGLTDDYFVVKNHHFIWKKHLYKLSDIKEIVFETQPRAPNLLRIITKDFKTKVYGAGTLLDKHWLEMMEKLQEKGVSVRNECFSVN